MTHDTRPNPDELLAQIQAEEKQLKRGKLKIFLGYAAGVGKTFAMLEGAHQRKAEGVDVVIGLVETHGRTETERMAADLETIPRKKVEYRGVTLAEMDFQAVLARRPQLVLVDELAHTNATGSLHPKRYQDVEELLEADIDVYTTLNIQHLESLNDVVAQITGITVHETVPDRVIDEATEIELVDLPPEELLQRLREGKVYVPDQAARAIQKFFRTGNLTALRELSMRRAAERVDDQMQGYMQTRAIPGPWPATERLLVCVSPSSLGERLVRAARRLADELNADWLAIYVETPDYVHLSQEERDRIAHNLRLAEELGARSIILPGKSVVDTVINYARQHNFTKLIAGKPLRSRWREPFSSPMVDQFIRHSGNIDVYVISSEPEKLAQKSAPAWPHRQTLARYFTSLLFVLAATGIGALIHPLVSPTNLVMVYLLAVVLAALYLGRGPAILVSILGLLSFDYFFVPPSFTFAVSDTEYLLTFAGMLVVGVVISQLTTRVREQVELVQRREIDMATLYALSRDLAVADRMETIIQAIITNIGQTFGREVVVLLPDPETEGRLISHGSGPEYTPGENEVAVAIWAFQHGQPAGRGTDTLPAIDIHFLPLKTPRGVVGILGVKPQDPKSRLTPEQARLLNALAGQAALAIERAQLADQARRALLMEATEKLQTALLNSISHDLRTPLVSITGALSSLKEEGVAVDDEVRRSLVDTAYQEADRLNRLVGNLLNMTRIEAGAMKVVREPGDIQDAIGTALEQLSEQLGERPITVDVPTDILLIPMDFVLIVQVLVNVFDNALKYSPEGSLIEAHALIAGAYMEVQIADRGIGIPTEDLPRVFDKFYRVQRPENVIGTGLGLSICKGIVEAHGGFIGAENRKGGGTIITMALPLNGVKQDQFDKE
jgi:two-component system sensor histidine kinase KdpD